MPYAVFLTADAARDLEELYDYVALHDAPGKAEYLLERIEKTFLLTRGFFSKQICLCHSGLASLILKSPSLKD